MANSMARRRERRSVELKAARVALQLGWRKVTGSSQRASVKASHEGLKQHLNFDGNEIEVARAAFAVGLISRRRIRGVIPDDALDGIVGRTMTSARRVVSEAELRAFYQSREWRQVAYKCKIRDGRVCMCCGDHPRSGVRIVSDHIIPLRVRWDLRLDPSNIQTLCDECNLGKGSWSAASFVDAGSTRVANGDSTT